MKRISFNATLLMITAIKAAGWVAVVCIAFLALIWMLKDM